jgi:cyclopropane fatty-acyl-phospholipid synthase-like methyltransferase
MTAPQPQTIQKLASAVPQALAMLAGMELDVFTPLTNGPLTAAQIADAIGVSADKLQAVLAVLVAAGLLSADGNYFANTPEADQFLVRGKPSYMGSVYELWSDLWRAEMLSAKSIRAGVPQAAHDYVAMGSEALYALVRGLHSGSVSAARVLMAERDLTLHRRLLDVGGGSGGLATTIAERFARIRATVVELPVVAPLMQQFIVESKAADRVNVLAMDIASETPSGSYDVAVCNRFIQVLSPANALRAITNIASALEPGGTLYIIGHVLDDSGLSPSAAVAFNLFAVNVFDGGQAHSERQHREWLTAAGFAQLERTMLSSGYSLVSARKSETVSPKSKI